MFVNTKLKIDKQEHKMYLNYFPVRFKKGVEVDKQEHKMYLNIFM